MLNVLTTKIIIVIIQRVEETLESDWYVYVPDGTDGFTVCT